MQLTSASSAAGVGTTGRAGSSAFWPSIAVAAALMLVFVLDRKTGSAPVQHLYYLPIMLASLRIGRRAGLSAAIVSILLYHLANPTLITSGYREVDVIQIALFLVIAMVTTRLSNDTRRLRQLAATDDLTGLHNLRSFEARLAAMVRASRETNSPLAMLVLDVDRLKSINDAHGHLAGAEAVRLVGHTLASYLPPEALACRYGGDEFVVAIANCGETKARRTADALRVAVHSLAPVLAGEPFPVHTLSISVGYACSTGHSRLSATAWRPDDVAVGEALFRTADRALYLAKERGRNGVAVASSR